MPSSQFSPAEPGDPCSGIAYEDDGFLEKQPFRSAGFLFTQKGCLQKWSCRALKQCVLRGHLASQGASLRNSAPAMMSAEDKRSPGLHLMRILPNAKRFQMDQKCPMKHAAWDKNIYIYTPVKYFTGIVYVFAFCKARSYCVLLLKDFHLSTQGTSNRSIPCVLNRRENE